MGCDRFSTQCVYVCTKRPRLFTTFTFLIVGHQVGLIVCSCVCVCVCVCVRALNFAALLMQTCHIFVAVCKVNLTYAQSYVNLITFGPYSPSLYPLAFSLSFSPILFYPSSPPPTLSLNSHLLFLSLHSQPLPHYPSSAPPHLLPHPPSTLPLPPRYPLPHSPFTLSPLSLNSITHSSFTFPLPPPPYPLPHSPSLSPHSHPLYTAPPQPHRYPVCRRPSSSAIVLATEPISRCCRLRLTYQQPSTEPYGPMAGGTWLSSLRMKTYSRW